MDPQPQLALFHFTYIGVLGLYIAKFIQFLKCFYLFPYNSLLRMVHFLASHLRKTILSVCVVILVAIALQGQMISVAATPIKKSLGLFDNALYIGDDVMSTSLKKALDVLDMASKQGINPPIFVIGDKNDPFSPPIFVRVEDLKKAPFDVLAKYVHPNAHQYPGLSPVFERERITQVHAQHQQGRWW